MGFLQRLPSFSKRNRNKIAEHSTVPTLLDPLKENVKPDIHQQPLNVTPLDTAANMNTKFAESNTDPSTTGLGLFDDIFTELNQASPSQDSLQTSISLSFALSQQLRLEPAPNQQQHQAKESLSSSSSSTKTTTAPAPAPAILFGQDSIYSSYVNKPQQDTNSFHHPSPPSSNAGVALSSSSHINTLNRVDDDKKEGQGATTQMVLDSDVSGSDDDDDDDEDNGSEDETWGTQQQQQQGRVLARGACPIMERRPNDHRWNINRHVDQHRNVMAVESNQTMLNRMKDRHRQQVKLQNIRPQTPPGMMMRPAFPMLCATPPPPSAMMAPLPPLLQRNSPITNTLTRSSSASSTYRHHTTKPWISDYSPSRPSPLSPNRSLRSQQSGTTTTITTSATSLRSASTMSQEDENDLATGDACSDDHEDADDEADHVDDDDNTLQRPTLINSTKYMPSSIHHSCSVPDLKNRKRHDAPASHTLVSDQHSTVSLSSSSSSSTTTTTTSRSPTPTPHLFPPSSTAQRHDGYSMHRMRAMTSEPDLKQLATMPQQHHYHHHAPMNHGYHHPLYFNQQQQQQQQYQQRLQWEMMQLYQREQQLKQEYMLLQQRSFSFSPIHKSSTLPSLSTVYQDPRFYYASSSFGPALH